MERQLNFLEFANIDTSDFRPDDRDCTSASSLFWAQTLGDFSLIPCHRAKKAGMDEHHEVIYHAGLRLMGLPVLPGCPLVSHPTTLTNF